MNSVAFPLTQLSDLLSMLRAKKFRRKAGLNDVLAIAAFAVDQLPDDPAEPIGPSPTATAMHLPGGHAGRDAFAAVVPDLERLESLYAQSATKAPGQDAMRGLFSGFDFKGLLAKLLPLILSLLSGAGA